MPNRWVLIPNIALWGVLLIYLSFCWSGCVYSSSLWSHFSRVAHILEYSIVLLTMTQWVSLKCSPNIFHHIMCDTADWVSRVIPHPDQTSIRGPCTKLYDSVFAQNYMILYLHKILHLHKTVVLQNAVLNKKVKLFFLTGKQWRSISLLLPQKISLLNRLVFPMTQKYVWTYIFVQ